MTTRFAVVLICSLSLVGCMSSVRVYRSDSLAAPPKGIPFYAKTGVCKQQTVWLEPQYTLTYEAKAAGLSYGPIDKVLNRQEYLQEDVQDFIAKPDPDPDVWTKTIFSLPGPLVFDEGDTDKIKSQESAGNWIRTANTGAVEAAVDYGNVFYLNSARPLAGTTQVDAKLATDGTLTEGSAQLQDQTLATIASTISSLVSSASTAATTAGALGSKLAAPVIQAEAKLTVKTKIYTHTHSQYATSQYAAKAPATPADCTAAPSGVLGGSYTVSEAADSTNAKPASAGKDNTITVSGSIVLPKAAAPTAPVSPSTAPSAASTPK